jgi:cytochrome c-type biogenesis protein CcmH/NrfF
MHFGIKNWVPHACPELSRRVSPILRDMRICQRVPRDLRRFRRLATLLVMTLLFLSAGNDSRVDRLGHQVICMCGCNQVLLECNHLGCPYLTRMKQELSSAVNRGDSDSTVIEYFVQTYGTLVLAAPTNSGFNRVAWIMPYLALLGGITLVVFVVWFWRKRPAAPHASVPAQVEREELARFREQARKETTL